MASGSHWCCTGSCAACMHSQQPHLEGRACNTHGCPLGAAERPSQCAVAPHRGEAVGRVCAGPSPGALLVTRREAKHLLGAGAAGGHNDWSHPPPEQSGRSIAHGAPVRASVKRGSAPPAAACLMHHHRRPCTLQSPQSLPQAKRLCAARLQRNGACLLVLHAVVSWQW